MAINDGIREAQARFAEAIDQDPDTAFSTVTASGRIEDGLRCVVTEGGNEAVMDLGPALGGTKAGPTPGFFARAGIAGCVSIGIKLAAARAGLELDTVAVNVATDFDDGALIGVGCNGAAPLNTRVSISIDSSEPEEAVRALVQSALSMDPWFLALRDAQTVRTSIKVGYDRKAT